MELQNCDFRIPRKTQFSWAVLREVLESGTSVANVLELCKIYIQNLGVI